MAVVTRNASSVNIKLDCGVNEKGKNVVKSKTYGNLKFEAKEDDVYEVVESMSTLQDHDLLFVTKLDSASLSK